MADSDMKSSRSCEIVLNDKVVFKQEYTDEKEELKNKDIVFHFNAKDLHPELALSIEQQALNLLVNENSRLRIEFETLSTINRGLAVENTTLFNRCVQLQQILEKSTSSLSTLENQKFCNDLKVVVKTQTGIINNQTVQIQQFKNVITVIADYIRSSSRDNVLKNLWRKELSRIKMDYLV